MKRIRTTSNIGSGDTDGPEDASAGSSEQSATAVPASVWNGAAVAAAPGSGSTRRTSDEARQEVLKALSTKLKLGIRRVVKFAGEPAQYRIETDLGSAQLGLVDALIGQSKLRVALADATRHYLPCFAPKEWPAIARALLEVVEEVDRGDEATIVGNLNEHLRVYFTQREVHPAIDDAHEPREPFLHNGKVHLFVDEFASWLHKERNERTPKNRLTADLRVLGACPMTVRVVIDGRQTTRSAWALPDGPWSGW